jgi:hypothetical protein
MSEDSSGRVCAGCNGRTDLVGVVGGGQSSPRSLQRRRGPPPLGLAHDCSSARRDGCSLGKLFIASTGWEHPLRLRDCSTSILSMHTVGSSPGVISVPGKLSPFVRFDTYARWPIRFGGMALGCWLSQLRRALPPWCRAAPLRAVCGRRDGRENGLRTLILGLTVAIRGRILLRRD